MEDPQGTAWETFHSLSAIPVFGEDAATVKAVKVIPPAVFPWPSSLVCERGTIEGCVKVKAVYPFVYQPISRAREPEKKEHTAMREQSTE
ncbi:MAG: hypothetical protein ACREYE_18845, partial [Gammaproteobacteria bacterium]